MVRQQRRFLPIALTGVLAATLAGCGGESDTGGGSNPDTETVAVVKTTAPDFSAGAHAVIGTEAPFEANTNLDPDGSDLTVRGHGSHFYRLARSNMNYIAKYPAENPGDAQWEWSLTDLNAAPSNPNPYDLVFAADDKAYLLQYGGTHARVVDPTATVIADFATGSIDLGHYANTQGDSGYSAAPQMAAGVIVDGRLYVVMQRLDDNYAPQQAYVAVIDVDTNHELEASPGHAAQLGIPLEVRNPQAIHYDAANNQLLINGVGQYFGAMSGGVEAIDLADTDCGDDNCYATRLLIDDDAAGAGHGRSNAIAVAGGGKAYLVGYQAYQDNDLYAFETATGNFVDDEPQVIAGLEATSLAAIAVSPAGRLWVSVADSSDPGMAIIDPSDDSVVAERVSTMLNPGPITFVSREQ